MRFQRLRLRLWVLASRILVRKMFPNLVMCTSDDTQEVLGVLFAASDEAAALILADQDGDGEEEEEWEPWRCN